MSKRSHITDEDRELFRRATGDVRRLEDDRAPPERATTWSNPPSMRKDDRTPPERTRKGLRTRDRTRIDRSDGSGEPVEPEWTSDVGPGDVLSFARGGVRRREMDRLRRGRFEVEADLDLHGRTVADAVAAIDRFFADSRRRGRRCVRIVHGKGFGSRNGLPIMKAHVDRWLRTRSEVLAFCSATPPDGGTGALYVLLGR